MSLLSKFALFDWMAMACIVAAVVLVIAAERGVLSEYRVAAVVSITSLGAAFVAVLIFSDVEDSVFLNIQPQQEEAKSTKTKRTGEEGGGGADDGAQAGKDESGPGDGDGGSGDTIKLGAAKGPEMPGGDSEMHGVDNKKKGGQGGGVDKKGGGDQVEMESGEGAGDGSGSSEGSNSNGSGGSDGKAAGGKDQDKGKKPGDKGGNGKDAAQDEFPVLKEAAAAGGGSLQDCPECPRMVLVVHGAFEIGSKPEDPGYGPEQGPVKSIRFRNPFYVGRFEVTRGEFAYFVKETKYKPSKGCVVGGRWLIENNWENPGFVQDQNHPVVCINWYDAVAYADFLTEKTKQKYRLPSESEWEYTARAGGKTTYGNGDELMPQDGNYSFRSYGTLPGGQFKPNAFGIQDMMGNAWEMTADCWLDNYEELPLNGRPQLREKCEKRVMRGGAWYSGARYLRSATRWANLSAAAGNGVGFRVARNFVPDDLKKTKDKNGKPVAATSVEKPPANAINAKEIEKAASQELEKQQATAGDAKSPSPATAVPASVKPAADNSRTAAPGVSPAASAGPGPFGAQKPAAAVPPVDAPEKAVASSVAPAAALAAPVAAAVGVVAARKIAESVDSDGPRTKKKSSKKKK